MGFDVLITDSRNSSNTLELLAMPQVPNYLDRLGVQYDHVVIDTPPVLAFPDALLWAKMADGVIVTSFAGHTAQQDLMDALERLEAVEAKVLGTVLNSVSSENSYNRYGYDYYTKQATGKRRHGVSKSTLLLPGKESSRRSKSNLDRHD
jgi:Mrp family chromosome partitioning ATPase